MAIAWSEQLASLPPDQARAALLTRSGRQFRTAGLKALVRQIESDTRSHAARALRLSDLGLSSARSIGDRLSEARFLRSQGHALRALNRFPESLRSYDRAIAVYLALGQAHEGAITQIGRIEALLYLGRYDEAIEAATIARRAFVRAGDRVRVARIDTNTGNIHHRRDQPEVALRWYDRARRLFVKLGEEGALPVVELNRGNVLSTLGRITEARGAYSAAARGFRRLGMRTQVGIADYSLAYLEFLDHRLPESLEGLTRIREEVERAGETRVTSLCDLDSAEIHLRLNAWSEAREEGARAAAGFQALGMRYEQAKALAFQGAASFQLGGLPAASAEWKRALKLFELEGNRSWCGQICVQLARAALRARRRAEAERHARHALEFLRGPAEAERRGQAHLALAAALLARGDRAGAARSFRRALEEARASRSPWLKHEALYALGEEAEGLGRTAAARNYYRAAAREGEKLRALLGTDDFRAAFHRDKGQPYLALAALELDGGSLNRAFAHLERGRARALLDLLTQVEAARHKPGLTRAERARLSEAEALLRRLGARQHRAAVSEREGKRDFTEQTTRASLLEEAQATRLLASLARGRSAPVAPLPSGDVRRLQAALLPHEALFEYFVIRGRVGAFAVTPDSIRVVRDLIGEEELDSIADSLRFQWGRFHIGAPFLEVHRERLMEETQADLAELRRRLWDPLMSDSRARAVVVVPAGPLHGLPWAALGGNDPLASRWAVSQAPSAEIFLKCRESARRRIRGKSLVISVADPLIPEADREARAVAALLPGSRVLTGSEATVQAFRELAPRASTLHLAAHGSFRRDHPLLSGLRLSDRWMSAYDFRMVPIRAGLVTLSACVTGRSEVWAGEEWMGLVRALLSAGASRVLASLWDVDDSATRKLMELFYHAYSKGVGASESLRKAQLDMFSTGVHPYMWAGFALVGDL